jgi:omega-6 fatty acid desaturase (delta-12 desaturase)
VKNVAPRSELYSTVEPFTRPRSRRAVLEILESFVPYLALSLTMIVAVRGGHPWVAAALWVVAAGFLVRIFIIFHDCCHGSFFRSRRANRVLGYAAGLLTLTPFDKWQSAHARHHATVGDLDRRGAGDVWTLTTDEYLAASRRKRLFYRVFRNPFIMFGVGPAVVFVVANRFCGRGAARRVRFSVYFTNAGLAAALLVAHLTIGLPALLSTQLPTLLLAGAAGVWLFYVQHQFDDAYWARHQTWEPVKAALEGSSYYKLPKLLQWFSGSIGLHHIHHVQPRIPFYNLQRCQDGVAAFQSVPPLTIRRSLHSLRLRVWDEEQRRMVGCAELRRRENGGPSACPSGRRAPFVRLFKSMSRPVGHARG